MSRMKRAGVCFLLLVGCVSAGYSRDLFGSSQLPDLPQSLTGVFAGTFFKSDVSSPETVQTEAILVGGGTSGSIFSIHDSVALWSADVYTLDRLSSTWEKVDRLERPVAYGGSVTTPDGIVCIGGMDAERCYASVFRLRWKDGHLIQEALPELPAPRAMAAVTLKDRTIYVLGGRESPAPGSAQSTCWTLDLDAFPPAWREIEPLPTTPRSLAMAAVQEGLVYLFGGMVTSPVHDDRFDSRYLKDGLRYQPGSGWESVAQLPVTVAGGTALAYGQSHILILGGVVGSANEGNSPHGRQIMNRDLFAYHTITNTWTTMGTLPESVFSSPAVPWHGAVVVPGGETAEGQPSGRVYVYRPLPLQGHFFTLDYIALIAYLTSLVFMGIYFSKREEGTADFFLAGRRVPWWAAGISIFGTQLSSITFMSIPAKVYATDWVYYLTLSGVVFAAPVVIYAYLPFFRRLNLTSIYAYLELRFNLAVRLFGSAAFVCFQLGRMAIVLLLPSLALEAVTGIPMNVCIIVMGILATFYTVLGGIEAVIWTDVLQVLVLIGGGLLSLAAIACSVEGGMWGVMSQGFAEGKFHAVSWSWDITTTSIWVVLVGNFFVNLAPYSSDQAVVQRYLTTKSEQSAAASIWTNAVMIFPVSLIWYLVGTSLYVFYKHHPDQLAPALMTDAIFPLFIAQELPAGISGLVIAGLFAATMSTLDSSLNSVSTVIVTDFYMRFRAGVSDRHCLNVAKWLTGLLGVSATLVSIWMADPEIRSLWDVYNTVLGLLLGSLAGLFALGVFTRKAHAIGALAGAAASAIVLYFVQKNTSVHFFLYAGIGILTCAGVGYAVSMVIPMPKKNLDRLTIYTLK